MSKFIVYKTTNLINGKYYIGYHKLNPKMNYLGSGNLIKKAVAKYGESNFTRETLYTFNTKDEATSKEKELVTVETVKDPNSYNLTPGGQGGFSHCRNTLERINKANKSISLASKKDWVGYRLDGSTFKVYKGVRSPDFLKENPNLPISRWTIIDNTDIFTIWKSPKSKKSFEILLDEKLDLATHVGLDNSGNLRMIIHNHRTKLSRYPKKHSLTVIKESTLNFITVEQFRSFRDYPGRE